MEVFLCIVALIVVGVIFHVVWTRGYEAGREDGYFTKMEVISNEIIEKSKAPKTKKKAKAKRGSRKVR